MIHVEGPPSSGATMLGKRLAADLHFRYEQQVPKGESLQELLTREMTTSPQTVVVHGYQTLHACARAIASSKYRQPLERWETRLLDRAALSQSAILIYTTAKPEEIAALADPKEKRDDFTRLICSNHQRLIDGYTQAVSWSTLPRQTVDGPRLLDDQYKKLLDWIRRELQRQQATMLHHQQHHSSGRIDRPVLAIVGDRYPEQGNDTRDQPGARAYLRATGASWTLHKALHAAELEDAYICNWYRSGDEVADLFTLRREMETINPEHIIALGTAAGRALRKLRIPHTEIGAPSHQKKYNAGAFSCLIKRMKEAASSAPAWPPVHLLTDL